MDLFETENVFKSRTILSATVALAKSSGLLREDLRSEWLRRMRNHQRTGRVDRNVYGSDP